MHNGGTCHFGGLIISSVDMWLYISRLWRRVIIINPVGANENHLSCRISPTHIAAIFWRPSLYIDSIAAGVKVHTYDAMFARKEKSLSFLLIK